jgi:SAM-dependent methyltransferase
VTTASGASREAAARAGDTHYDYYFAKGDLPLRERLLRRRARVLLGLAAKGMPAGSLLEVGPGVGFVADAATEQGWTYEAIEANRSAGEALAARGYRVHLGVVPPLPALDRPFDLALASHVIEHLPSGDSICELLSALRDGLSDTGRLCLAFPDYLDDDREFWDVDYTHRWPSTVRRVRQVLHDSGYTVVEEAPLRASLEGRAAWLALPPRIVPLRFLQGRSAISQAAYRARLFCLREIVVVAQPRRESLHRA